MSVQSGFLFCICPDGKLLRQQVEELLDAPRTPPVTWERHVFWGDEELPKQFWERLTLQGLFDTAQALIIRNAHNLPVDTWKRLSSALGHPNTKRWPFLCLEGAWEKGQPKIPAHIQKLPCFSFAERKGWCWKHAGLEGRTLRRYIQDRSAALGLSLTSDALTLLAETLPVDASSIDNELTKLALFAGGETLAPEALSHVSHTPAFNVFLFLRQLQAGQSAQVWQSVLEEQRKGEEPLFYLLAMLQREVKQLWQLLAGEEVRLPSADRTAKQQAAARLGVSGLVAFWDALHTAELAVKSGQRSPTQALEALLGELTLLCSQHNPTPRRQSTVQ